MHYEVVSKIAHHMCFLFPWTTSSECSVIMDATRTKQKLIQNVLKYQIVKYLLWWKTKTVTGQQHLTLAQLIFCFLNKIYYVLATESLFCAVML